MLQLVPATCLGPLMQYACTSSYPRIEATSTRKTRSSSQHSSQIHFRAKRLPHSPFSCVTANSYAVLFACKSTCQTMVAQCGALLTTAGKGALVPQCDAAIPGTTQTISPSGVLFQPDEKCNTPKSLSGGNTGDSGNQTTTTCISPLIADSMKGPGGTSTNPTYCMAGCCLPCPAQYSLYREGALETGFKITNTMRAISMVFSFLLMMSYIFLPDKRSHPSALILFFSVCVFLFSAVVIFPLVNTGAMQCVDPYTPSTQQNNLKCAIQGIEPLASACLRSSPSLWSIT